MESLLTQLVVLGLVELQASPPPPPENYGLREARRVTWNGVPYPSANACGKAHNPRIGSNTVISRCNSEANSEYTFQSTTCT